jgi:hypothetical protein
MPVGAIIECFLFFYFKNSTINFSYIIYLLAAEPVKKRMDDCWVDNKILSK